MTILAVVGLAREARIIAGGGVRVIVGAGRALYLRQEIEKTIQSNVRGIISIGIAGALSPILSTGDCVLASAVQTDGRLLRTDERWTEALRQRLPGTVPTRILGTDSILATAYEKRRQFARTAAHAVDTESHVVAAVATERKIPFAVLRVILDPANRDLPPAAIMAIRPDGSTNPTAVLKSVISQPSQIPLLIRTGCDSRVAFRSLLRCQQSLGPAFAAPDSMRK